MYPSRRIFIDVFKAENLLGSVSDGWANSWWWGGIWQCMLEAV